MGFRAVSSGDLIEFLGTAGARYVVARQLSDELGLDVSAASDGMTLELV